MSNSKDTIYIDVDDEITSIIDKVQGAQQDVIALVLPKRASVLQSSVNMKLLKRAAEKIKKSVVLITTEASLLPLASSVGLYVAKDLQSRPAIPKVAPVADVDELASTPDTTETDFDPKSSSAKAVGELAGGALAAEALAEAKPQAMPELTPLAYKKATDPEESVMLDNTDEPDKEAKDTNKKVKDKGDKKLKVPNFNKFRTSLLIGFVVLVALIIGFIIANKILPKANITILTNTSNVNSSVALTLDSTTKTLNAGQMVVPANIQQSQQTGKQQVNTTGEDNEGQTATGTVQITAEVCGGPSTTPSSIPAGVGLSDNGLTFITEQTTVFKFSTPTGGCESYSATHSTSISAQDPGSKYNVSGPFTISYQDSNNSGTTTTYSAQGSTSGGTDNNVQVVSQADITNATNQITLPASSIIKTALEQKLTTAGYYPIPATYTAGTPTITPSSNVGEQATTVTVTETVTYTMFGASKSGLNTLITNSVDQQINTSQQAVLDTGLNQANYSGLSQNSTQAQLTIQTVSTVGPNFNITQIKNQIAGMKKGDLENKLEQYPGVTGVTVKYSPFWVSGTPKNITKITINIKKAS